jgi:hypothetical protein
VVARNIIFHCNVCGTEWFKASGRMVGEFDPNAEHPKGERAATLQMMDDGFIKFPGGSVLRRR